MWFFLIWPLSTSILFHFYILIWPLSTSILFHFYILIWPLSTSILFHFDILIWPLSTSILFHFDIFIRISVKWKEKISTMIQLGIDIVYHKKGVVSVLKPLNIFNFVYIRTYVRTCFDIPFLSG